MTVIWKQCVRIVALVGLAGGLYGCSLISQEITASPIVIPTQIDPITPTSTPALPPAITDTPAPLPTGQTPFPNLLLNDTLYHHANDLFELYPPQDWDIEEDDSSVSFNDPQGNGFIYLQVTNTGRELDEASFEKFIDAREQNFFGMYEQYTELDRQINQDERIGSVSKSLVFEGVPQSVVTFYDQKGQAMYALDFWVDSSTAQAYSAMYDDLFNQITVDSSSAAALEPYAWVFEFQAPSKMYSLNLPTSWVYDSRQEADVRIDLFTSPDGQANIQVLVFSAGRQVGVDDLKDVALQLLKQHVQPDLQLADTQLQASGSLRLTWVSPSTQSTGTTFADIRGSNVILLSSSYVEEDRQIFEGLLNFMISSYKLP